MTEIIIELDYSDGVMHLADFRWRSLDVRLSHNNNNKFTHKRRKVRVFVWKGIRKNIISYYSSTITICWASEGPCKSVRPGAEAEFFMSRAEYTELQM